MATDVVLFALEREARPFRRFCPNVPVYLTGVGIERARQVVEAILNQSMPQRLILAGFGGSLTTTSKVGEVIVARDVVNESGEKWICCEHGTGRVVTVNRMIGTVEEKLALGQRFQADVCDMESAAVAAICQSRGVPFQAVRAISDTAERTLSPTLDRLIVNGQVSKTKALAAMMREPKLTREFYRLARDTRFAARKLAESLATHLQSAVNQ